MQTEGYEFVPNEDNEVYIFFSNGPRGVVTKMIVFEEVGLNNFNVAFGDYDFNQNKFDDKIITDNKDTIKVLATVIKIMLEFFEKNPDAEVLVEGNSTVRKKLYHKIVCDNWNQICLNFTIFGIINGHQEPFLSEKYYQKLKIVKKNEKR
jgi:hypothetical protein